MTQYHKTLTIEEFEQFVDRPENIDRDFELIHGEIVEVSPSKDRQTVIAARFIYFIGAHVIPNDLGHVIGADGGFKLTDGDFFEPDAAFISKARYPQMQDAYFNIAPDIAVEVISPGNTRDEIAAKVETYLRTGTKLIWLIYPQTKTVIVHSPGGSTTLGINDTLDDGDVLPGFRLAVREIFI